MPLAITVHDELANATHSSALHPSDRAPATERERMGKIAFNVRAIANSRTTSTPVTCVHAVRCGSEDENTRWPGLGLRERKVLDL